MRHMEWKLLVALALAGAGLGCSRTCDSQQAQRAVLPRDCEVLEAVVTHLLADEELARQQQLVAGTSRIVLQPSTPGPSSFLSDPQLDSEGFGGNERLLPRDLRSDLRKRNGQGRYGLQSLAARTSGRILIDDVSDWLSASEFRARHPQARAYVEPWLPGYSSDGKTAVVRMWIGPPREKASIATYFLARESNGWRIRWRTVCNYM